MNYAYYPQLRARMCKYQIEYGYGAPIEAFVEKAVIIVIMVLDLRKGTLSFALKMSGERAKAQDQGVMYSDIERKKGLFYSLAVSLAGEKNRAHIIRCRFD